MRKSDRERSGHFLVNGRFQSVDFSDKGGGNDFGKSLFSVFIGNLNLIVDSTGLWSMFKSFGKVRDVFLSSKKPSGNSYFTFIRFGS